MRRRGAVAGDGLPVVEGASFTRERVERVIELVVALGCVVVGAQTLVVALGDAHSMDWHGGPLLLVVFLPLVALIGALLTGWRRRLFATAFMAAFTVVLLLWPALMWNLTSPQPWPFYLLNVGTIAAIFVFSVPGQISVAVLVPVLYGVGTWLALPASSSTAVWIPVALDAVYALIFGCVLLTLAWLFRAAASDVDERRMRAVRSFARAAEVTATEQERVAVAALMHDSVIAALLAAGRATSQRERELAAVMAGEALTRLANTEGDADEGGDAPVPVVSIRDGIAAAVAEFGVDVPITLVLQPGAPQPPQRVARAMVLAATQAVSNAIQHADGAGLAILVEGYARPARIVVTVRDSGPGFDPDDIPADRLGIRASIIARMSAFGGHVELTSGRDGTVVRLGWRAGRP